MQYIYFFIRQCIAYLLITGAHQTGSLHLSYRRLKSNLSRVDVWNRTVPKEPMKIEEWQQKCLTSNCNLVPRDPGNKVGQTAVSKASAFMNFHGKVPSDGLLLIIITCFSSSADMYPLPSLSNTLNAFLNSSSIVMLACLAAINWRNSLKSISPLPAENKLFNSFQKSKEFGRELNYKYSAKQQPLPKMLLNKWVMRFGEATKIQFCYIVFVKRCLGVSVVKLRESFIIILLTVIITSLACKIWGKGEEER